MITTNNPDAPPLLLLKKHGEKTILMVIRKHCYLTGRKRMLHLLIERKPGKYENLCECFSCLLVNDFTMAFKCLILSPFFCFIL